ncbi:MAG: alginate export family protein, partial [Deltaproteobacteria bacterium]|nr:alginate export family protein [Deltaproteobacteria bacterium]
ECKPWKGCYFKAEFHQLRLAEKKDAWYLNPKEYRDKSGKSGDAVGKELDIVVKLDLPKNNELQLGFGHFWPDEFARKMASGKQADWVFFQWRHRFSWEIL